jgi:hypothetical protein
MEVILMITKISHGLLTTLKRYSKRLSLFMKIMTKKRYIMVEATLQRLLIKWSYNGIKNKDIMFEY